jgi:hypothetical protein
MEQTIQDSLCWHPATGMEMARSVTLIRTDISGQARLMEMMPGTEHLVVTGLLYSDQSLPSLLASQFAV